MKIKKLFAAVITVIIACFAMSVSASADVSSEQEVDAAIEYIESLNFTPDATVVNTSSAYAFVLSVIGDIRTSYNVEYIIVSTIDQNPTTEAAGVYSFYVEITAPLYGSTMIFSIDIPRLLSDAESVAADKAALTWASIANGNTGESAITTDLILPATGDSGTTISWSSSEPTVITDGGVVTSPLYSVGDVDVTLTATITKGEASDTVIFSLKVLKAEPSTDATLSSLSVTGGSLTPTFDPLTTEYNVTVPYGYDEISISATAENSYATIDGADAWILIEVGTTEFEVTVTAEDDLSTETYTITVTRAARVLNLPLVLDPILGLTYGGSEAITADVLPVGSYVWNSSTDTLTLNGVNFTTTAATALDLSPVSGLNLIVSGTNSIRTVYSGSEDVYGVEGVDITVSGTGRLTVDNSGSTTTGDNFGYSGGFGSNSTFSLTDATVEFIGGPSTGSLSRSRGMSNISTLTVNSGSLKTIGGTVQNPDNGGYASIGFVSSGSSPRIYGGVVHFEGYTRATAYTITTKPVAYTWEADSTTGAYPSGSAHVWANTQKKIIITSATGVSPTTATFNKADPEDVVITYSLATGNTLESITLGQQTLYLNAQYDEDTIGTLEIRRSYLSNLSNGTNTLTLNTSGDTDPTVTLTIITAYEYGLVLKSDGLYYNNAKLTANDSKLGGGSYTYSGTTLTLNGVNFSTSAQYGLVLSAVDDVTINLTGSNSITSICPSSNPQAVYSSENVTINGPGSLTAATGNSTHGMCVMQAASLTINSGTITATAGNGGTAINRGLFAGVLNINGGTVTVTSGPGGNSYAVGATSGEINITGGTVTATAGTATTNSYGISVTSGEINITGGIVTATGSKTAFSKTPDTLPTYYRYKIGDDTNYTKSWHTEYSYSTAHKQVLIETRSQIFGVSVTGGTVDGSLYETGDTVTVTPTTPTGYSIKNVTISPAISMTHTSNGTYAFTMPSEAVTVTITYEAAPVDSDNSDNPGSSGNSDNSNRPDIALPPKSDDTEETDDEDTDDSNEENRTNLKVNGELTDTSVAMPTEQDDKTADVKVDGKTTRTYSLTAAEAIADGEVREAFVSETGGVAAVTSGGNVIAGANASESLNSASTIEALKAAAVEGEVEIITVYAGQEVTGVSDNTIEKIIAVDSEYGINTQIQKTQYSLDENEQIDELIYRITIPVENTNIRDIRLGAEFGTSVVEASKIAFEETFGNTDCAGFALSQRETFGTDAQIQVKASAIGFEAEPGDTVYVAIFNTKTGRFTQVEGLVGDNGFISFKTDKSGVVIISATSFTK